MAIDYNKLVHKAATDLGRYARKGTDALSNLASEDNVKKLSEVAKSTAKSAKDIGNEFMKGFNDTVDDTTHAADTDSSPAKPTSKGGEK